MTAGHNTARLFCRVLVRNTWAWLAVASTVLTVVLMPSQWRSAVPFGLATIVIIGAFETVGVIGRECDARLASLHAEIERLKARPYDFAQRRLCEEKLQTVGLVGRDLLRYLLQRGPYSAPALFKEAQKTSLDTTTYETTFRSLRKEGLIECPPGQTGWWLTAPFEDALKDLLFPRQEPAHWQHFRP